MPTLFNNLRNSLSSLKSPVWPTDHDPMPSPSVLVDRDWHDKDDARLMTRVAEGYPIKDVRSIVTGAERHARDVIEQTVFVREWAKRVDEWANLVVRELHGVEDLTLSMREDACRMQATIEQYAALVQVLGLAQAQALSRLEVADGMLWHVKAWVALARARTHQRFADFDRTRSPTSPAPAPDLNIEYFATMLNELTSVEWAIDALQPAVDKATARLQAQKAHLARAQGAIAGAAALVDAVLDGSEWHDTALASDVSDAAEASESGVPVHLDTPRLGATSSTDAEDALESPTLAASDDEGQFDTDEAAVLAYNNSDTTHSPLHSPSSIDLADVSKFVALHDDNLRLSSWLAR